MLDIIFFAILAGFILTRLFKILGDTNHDNESNTGREKQDPFIEELQRQYSDDMETKKEMVQQIDIASGLEAELSEKDREVFEQIRKHDRGFTADKFVAGAKSAFEMILKEFADGNKVALKQLLSAEVYKDFAKEIDRRKKAKEKHETTIVSLQSFDIVGTEMDKNSATISVKIDSEQVHVVKDANGKVKGGNASNVILSEDIWSFSKNLRSKSKVWELVATN